MRSRARQHGIVLVTTLLLLVVVTALAVSSIRTGTVNLRIVRNMQSEQLTKSIARDASNRVMSDIDNFNNWNTTPTITIDGIDVDITQRDCIDARPASGYSATWGLAPQDTTWEYTATIDDGIEGAEATVLAGVEIRMTTGSC